MTDPYDIPTLLFFESGNVFSGSRKAFGFKIRPTDGALQASVWNGELCMEKSEILDTQEFPCNEEGRAAMIEWLREKDDTPEAEPEDE